MSKSVEEAESEVAEEDADMAPTPVRGKDKQKGVPKGVPKDKSKAKDKTGAAKKSEAPKRQKKGNLVFPVHRFAKSLKRGGYCRRLSGSASVYLTAVIEYITAEILELAGNAAKDQKKNRIIPRHIQLAIRNDEELNKYMGQVTISGGGVLPNIHSVLFPKKPTKGKEGAAAPAASVSQEF
mmetsp:Transcript_82417/g.167044  ORF Transcript_82417/g.167044 Transcript_82417/m.167044 type:complete len:181 (-) Transcript_82417:141-683(-)